VKYHCTPTGIAKSGANAGRMGCNGTHLMLLGAIDMATWKIVQWFLVKGDGSLTHLPTIIFLGIQRN
jgi:hypothetical protein